MKIFVLVCVVVAVAVFAYRGCQSETLDRAPVRVPGVPVVDAPPGPARDFKSLSGLLQADMGKIPADLKSTRQVPSNAFDIKAKLQGFTQMHEEYQVLDQVCDLIIYADQEHSVRQRACGLAQNGTYTSRLEKANAADRDKIAQTESEAIYQKNQALWAGYRTQTAGEVRRLLATLDNKRL